MLLAGWEGFQHLPRGGFLHQDAVASEWWVKRAPATAVQLQVPTGGSRVVGGVLPVARAETTVELVFAYLEARAW